MLFRQLLDFGTCAYTYLIADEHTQEAILIDPVLAQAERDLRLLTELGLRLVHCLETHVHSQYPSGASRLRQMTGCSTIVPAYAVASCANRAIHTGEQLRLGTVAIEAIATPGHTDHHLAYLVNGDRLLTGDSLLIRGCGRTDLEGGDPGRMHHSVTHILFRLPHRTWVYPGHDYRGNNKSTIGDEKRWNPRFAGQTKESFREYMTQVELPSPDAMMEAMPNYSQPIRRPRKPVTAQLSV
ncbi:MAG: MBL fold metallo-hydrolase [Cyanobacteria bacterium P01_F01_bin.150]